ncbi:MAG: MC/SLC25 family protein [Parachlamydiaceae bacterium]
MSLTPTNSRLTDTGTVLNGMCSSAVTIPLMHPLSTIRTSIMSGKGLPHVSTLYKGVLTTFTGVVPIQTISFFTQGVLVNHCFGGDRNSMSDRDKIAVGACAGAATSLPFTLFDRIVIIKQQQGGKSSLDTIQRIRAATGSRGLMKGAVPTLGREVSYFVAVFGTSEVFASKIKKVFPESSEKVSSFSGKITAGALSGALTVPIDVIKTRMQRDLEGKYPTIRKTVHTLIREEGLASLMKGIGIRPFQSAIGVLLLCQAKEATPSFLPSAFFN